MIKWAMRMISAPQKWLRVHRRIQAARKRLFKMKWVATLAAAVTRTSFLEKRCQT